MSFSRSRSVSYCAQPVTAVLVCEGNATIGNEEKKNIPFLRKHQKKQINFAPNRYGRLSKTGCDVKKIAHPKVDGISSK